MGSGYFPVQQTHWAWRHSPHGRLNYTSFTVAYNAREVLEKQINVIQELYMMPIREPERFRSLRLGVARAARHMTYAETDRKEGVTRHMTYAETDDVSHADIDCKKSVDCDAFETFKSIVVARGIELKETRL